MSSEFTPPRKVDFVVDVDDLVDESELALFDEIRVARPDFRVTCYAIPNKLGPVHELRERYPWVVFGIHGFEHTHFECLSWTEAEARRLISLALSMGYDSVFKPPNWIVDEETERACRDLGVCLHHHQTYFPTTVGLKSFPGPKRLRSTSFANLHTHISKNASTDWIGEHPGFKAEHFGHARKFFSVEELAVEVPDENA